MWPRHCISGVDSNDSLEHRGTAPPFGLFMWHGKRKGPTQRLPSTRKKFWYFRKVFQKNNHEAQTWVGGGGAGVACVSSVSALNFVV